MVRSHFQFSEVDAGDFFITLFDLALGRAVSIAPGRSEPKSHAEVAELADALG
jgi:hypothetical protein